MPLPLVTIEGRAVADPELRFSNAGMAVGSFRIACSSRKQNEQGEWVDDKHLFLPVSVFGQLAENTVESVRKGDQLVVVGRIYTDEWTTDQGENRSMIKMNADAVGVTLRFRTVRHGEGRVERSSGGADSGDDPWRSGTPTAASASQSEDPPF